jgi:hypothetical protein
MNDFLPKPLRIPDLKRVISEAYHFNHPGVSIRKQGNPLPAAMIGNKP